MRRYVHWLGFCVRFLLCMLHCSAVRHCLLKLLFGLCYFPIFVHPTDGALISGESAINFRRSYGPLIAGVMALIANSGAYVCEIFRAGIQSIDKGQMEAARSLGLTIPRRCVM